MKYYLLALQNYITFTGRSTRKEFWYFFLFNFIFSVSLNVLGVAIGFELLGTIYSLALFLPGIAAGVRRLHDAGKSGWFLLIPIYNLILLLTDSQFGENKWGPDPKANE